MHIKAEVYVRMFVSLYRISCIWSCLWAHCKYRKCLFVRCYLCLMHFESAAAKSCSNFDKLRVSLCLEEMVDGGS